MVVAALVTWITKNKKQISIDDADEDIEIIDTLDGVSEETALLKGEYKTILKIVGVLSNGRLSKRLTDRAIDVMSAIQNLRKAIYDYKLKVDAAEVRSAKYYRLRSVAYNYLHRYATLIVFANYLLEGPTSSVPFPAWLKEHREITTIMNRLELE